MPLYSSPGSTPFTGPRPWIDVRTYGALGDGTTNDTAAIQAAIDAVPTAGGVVYLPANVYVVNGSLTCLNKENVTLRGDGADHDIYSGNDSTKGTILKRVSGTGTLLSVGATNAATRSVSGMSIEGITIDGNELATTGLLITSVYGGSFKDLHVRNCSTVAIDVTTTTTNLSGIEVTQACVFEKITVRQVESVSGIGIRLDSGTSGQGNTSLCTFTNLVIAHKNGVGLQLNDADSNQFFGVLTNQVAGTGIGIELNGDNASGNARGNTLFAIDANGGVTSRATGFSSPAGIATPNLLTFSRENSQPLPTVELGSVLTWINHAGSWGNLAPDFRRQAYMKDDFMGGSTGTGTIGELGWITTTSITHQTGVVGRPGVARLASTATPSAIGLLRVGTAAIMDPDDPFDVTFIIALVVNDADTICRCGIAWNSNNNPPADGIYVEKLGADTSWFGVTRASSSETRTAALVATSTSFVKFRIRRKNATTIAFSVNDGTEVTATATIPGNACGPFLHISNNAASADKTVDIDFFEMRMNGISR